MTTAILEARGLTKKYGNRVDRPVEDAAQPEPSTSTGKPKSKPPRRPPLTKEDKAAAKIAQEKADAEQARALAESFREFAEEGEGVENEAVLESVVPGFKAAVAADDEDVDEEEDQEEEVSKKAQAAKARKGKGTGKKSKK